jgi:DNA-binding MurR/RpiR family transcriptional regulator
MKKTPDAALKPLSDFESLRNAIIERKSALPKRLAQAAAFALDYPDDIAFGTAASIAEAAGVQPSTLVRLAHSFGFDGFTHFQSVFRERLRDKSLTYADRLVGLEQSGLAAEMELLTGFLEAGRLSLDRLAATLPDMKFGRAVELLAKAETIFLIARRRSYPLTSHLAYAFGKLGIRHQMIASPNGVDAEIADFATPRDAAIAISFASYASESVALVRSMHERAVPVVALTDSAFSPLAENAAVLLEVAEADFAGFRSISASFILVMALPVAIAEYRRKMM